MHNRRITALLLTAFLAAEVVWHWDAGQSRIATTMGAWTEAAQGAYRAVGSGFLVPQQTGPVLQMRSTGVVTADPTRTFVLPGQQVEIYGHGSAAVAVARSGGGTQSLPAYDGGFITVDSRQNLWQVTPAGVHLLIGGTVGQYGRAMLLEDAKTATDLPRTWRLLWVADPVVVGTDVWYISNRDERLGSPDFYVWRHGAAGDARLSGLDALAPLDLLGASADRVFAEQQGTTLMVLDAHSDTVIAQMPDTLPLSIAQGGTAALLEEFGGSQTRLALYTSAGAQLIPLPHGIGNPGVASFSADGHYLCLIVHRGNRPAVYVARVGTAGVESGMTILPPVGAQIATEDPPTEAGGRVFVVVRLDGQIETWSRLLDNGQGAL